MVDILTRAEIDAGAQALYELAGREWLSKSAPQTPWAEQPEDVHRYWKNRAEVCLHHTLNVRGSLHAELERAREILAGLMRAVEGVGGLTVDGSWHSHAKAFLANHSRTPDGSRAPVANSGANDHV